ncbi:MAG: hypothetical protein ACE5H3_02540 [Planctomycetota bacterium]
MTVRIPSPPSDRHLAEDRALLIPPFRLEPPPERRVGRYTVRLLGPEENGPARALYALTGDPIPPEDVWLWRFYSRNPELAHVAATFDDRGELAGLYPCVARPIRVGGRDLMTLQACRTIVHPDHRWGGRVFYLTAMYSHDRVRALGIPFAFGGGANEAAVKVGSRLVAYTLMQQLEVRERRLSLRLALQRRLGRAGAFLGDALRLLAPGGRRRDAGGFEVAPVLEAGAEFDRLWERKRDAYPAVLRRDAREVEWRWFRCPVPAVLLAARKGGELEGYAALRHQAEGPARITTILDLFAGRDLQATATLLEAAGEEARREGSDFLQFAPSPNGALFASLQRKPWRRARRPLDHVIFRDLCPEPGRAGLEKEMAIVKNGSNWFYCQGDSDFRD